MSFIIQIYALFLRNYLVNLNEKEMKYALMNSIKGMFVFCMLSSLFFVNCSQGDNVGGDENATESEVAEAVEVDPMDNKGIGPINEIVLGDLNEEWVAEGEKIYKEKCTACHKPTEKFIGPAQAGVIERRSPEWIMNMILNPEEMLKKDPIAKKLLIEYNMAPMANQNLTEEDARKILEYFRTI